MTVVSARVSLKRYLTNDCGRLAKWRTLYFHKGTLFHHVVTFRKKKCEFSPRDDSEGENVRFDVDVWAFPQPQPVFEFSATELHRRGPGVHLFHSPYAIVIAWVQVLIFLLDTFSPCPPAYFPLLDQVWEDNVKPHSAAESPPGRNSFYSERVKSRYRTETWEEI